MIHKPYYLLMITLLFLSLCFCCVSPEQKKYVRQGREYGVTKGLFRHKWWNYYERGQSFSSGLFWNKAEQDFREAIRQRPDDQRRARTYGMHFIDYFPHRELGVTLYDQGRLSKAIQELQTSLSTQESARAKFYLNKARRAWLKHSAIKDSNAPQIRISAPDNGYNLNTFSVTVSGTVEDEGYVSSVVINGKPQFIELARQNIRFETKIPLKPGPNLISIKAEDLTGNHCRESLVVHGDFRGPRMSLVDYMNGQTVENPAVDLKLAFADRSGVKSIAINDVTRYQGSEKNRIMVCPLMLKRGVNHISMIAEDMAGNLTRGNIKLVLQPKESRVAASCLTHGTFKEQAGPWPLLSQGGSIASDAVYTSGAVEKDKKSSPDSSPPKLRFKGVLENVSQGETLTIVDRKHQGRFFVEGQVSAADTVADVFINGEPVISPGGKEVIFNRLVELKAGKNKIIIKAVDAKGNEVQRTVTVHRKIQTIDLTSSRMTLSIMPFKNDTVSPALAESVYNLFVDELINEERFNIVGRGVDLEAILRELKLSRTDLVDKAKALETGKLLGSETIMMGIIIERENSIEMFAKLINTETSKVMATHDIFDMDKKRTRLEYLMEGLASKFVYSVPLLDGNVLAVKKDKFYLDLGRKKNVHLQNGIECIAYRTEPFVVNGEVLGEDVTVLGTLQITAVQDKFCIARLSEIKPGNGQPATISTDDRVITK
ncbi:MAG: CsgG/HfaB family protein [Thermodesulfobacteriota bacterium]|nr:CsgG/HfaB family protein [Thermodesulfobacteriota bacterium]